MVSLTNRSRSDPPPAPRPRSHPPPGGIAPPVSPSPSLPPPGPPPPDTKSPMQSAPGVAAATPTPSGTPAPHDRTPPSTPPARSPRTNSCHINGLLRSRLSDYQLPTSISRERSPRISIHTIFPNKPNHLTPNPHISPTSSGYPEPVSLNACFIRVHSRPLCLLSEASSHRAPTAISLRDPRPSWASSVPP